MLCSFSILSFLDIVSRSHITVSPVVNQIRSISFPSQSCLILHSTASAQGLPLQPQCPFLKGYSALEKQDLKFFWFADLWSDILFSFLKKNSKVFSLSKRLGNKCRFINCHSSVFLVDLQQLSASYHTMNIDTEIMTAHCRSATCIISWNRCFHYLIKIN